MIIIYVINQVINFLSQNSHNDFTFMKRWDYYREKAKIGKSNE